MLRPSLRTLRSCRPSPTPRAERRFLVTGDDAFLGTDASGRRVLSGHFADARNLAGGNALVLAALDVKEQRAGEWLRT